MAWTIHHGDCLEVMARMDANSVDAVVTDPPYCSGGATEAARGGATHQGLRSETIKAGRFKWFGSDNMTTAGLVWLLRRVAVESSRVLTDTGSMLVFCDWRMAFSLGPAMESAGFRLRNIIAWDKGHFGCGTGFRPQHELILHLTKRAPKFYSASVGNVITTKRVCNKDRMHPTEKPLELMRKLVRVVTPHGGTVLDPFSGSGSTGEAAAMEGLGFIGIEREAEYVQIARARIAAVESGPGPLFEAG
jgi:DNA modification methylase